MNKLWYKNSILLLITLSSISVFGVHISSSEDDCKPTAINQDVTEEKPHSPNDYDDYVTMLHDCQLIVKCPLCFVPTMLDQELLSRVLPSSCIPFLSTEAREDIIRMLSFGPGASPFFPFWIQHLNIDFIQALRNSTNLALAETLVIWQQAFPLCPDVVSAAARIVNDQRYDIRVQLTAFVIMYEKYSESEIMRLSREIVERNENIRSFHPYLISAAWTVLLYIGDEDGF